MVPFKGPVYYDLKYLPSLPGGGTALETRTKGEQVKHHVMLLKPKPSPKTQDLREPRIIAQHRNHLKALVRTGDAVIYHELSMYYIAKVASVIVPAFQIQMQTSHFESR